MKIKSRLLKNSLFLSLPALCFFAADKTYAQSGGQIVQLVPPQIKIECKNTFINTNDALPADVFEAASAELGGKCDTLVQLESFDRKKTAFYRLSCTTGADGSCIAFKGTVGKMVRDYNAKVVVARDSNKLSIAFVPKPRLDPKKTEVIKIFPGSSFVRYIDYRSSSLSAHCAGGVFSGGPSYESISHKGLIDSQQVMTPWYYLYRNFETTAFVTNETSLGCNPGFLEATSK